MSSAGGRASSRGAGLAFVAGLLAQGCLEARPPAPDPVCVPGPTESCTRIHDRGILDVASAEFHGVLIAKINYDIALCNKCHGGTGEGRAGVPCAKCHDAAPTDCVTCHARIADSGAHRRHLEGGVLGLTFDCDACHQKPRTLLDPGHVRDVRGQRDFAPVEVRFDARARRGEVEPLFDRARGTCSGVACHGAAELTWKAGEAQGCALCHGDPPASHASDRCQDCHPRVADQEGLVSPSLHLDGRVDLGKDGAGTCTSCHDPSDAGHRAHLSGPRVRGPLACADCHRQPQALNDPGHLDSLPPAEVFPPGFTGLGAARGAAPVYAGGRCASTYCHGPGELTWGTPAPIHCESCHGVPPPGPAHLAEWPLTLCAECHGASVDQFGNPRFEADGSSPHLNGVIDR